MRELEQQFESLYCLKVSRPEVTVVWAYGEKRGELHRKESDRDEGKGGESERKA